MKKVWVFVFLLCIGGMAFGAGEKGGKGTAVNKQATPTATEPVLVPVPPPKNEPMPTAPAEQTAVPAAVEQTPVATAEETAKKEEPQEAADTGEKKPLGLRALALAGGSRVTEDHLGAHGSIDAQVAFGYELPYGFCVGAAFGVRLYDHEYLSLNPDIDGGGNQRLNEAEQWYDTRLLVTYNALSTLTDIKAVELNALLALRYTQTDNDAFAEWSGGVQLGLEVVGRIAKNMHLSAAGAWSMATFGTDSTLSLLGLARHYGDASVGIGFDFPGIGGTKEWSIELRWAGTVVVHEHSTRFYNGALAGLGVRF